MVLSELDKILERIRAIMIKDPSDQSLQKTLWISSPHAYLRSNAVRIFGQQPTPVVSMLSLNPPLFECKLVAHEEKKIVGIGHAKTKKEAERLATIQLCRVIDELDSGEVARLKSLAQNALKGVPMGVENKPWLKNLNGFLDKRSRGLPPKITTSDIGGRFLTEFSCGCATGLGLASSKKESLRLAQIHACCQLDGVAVAIQPTFSSQENVHSIHNSQPIENYTIGDFLSHDLPEFMAQPWYEKPKDYLHGMAMKLYSTPPSYDVTQISQNGKALFHSVLTVSGDGSFVVGRGLAGSSKEASRLAAISYIAQSGLVNNQRRVSNVNPSEEMPPHAVSEQPQLEQQQQQKIATFTTVVEYDQLINEPWFEFPRDEVYHISSKISGKIPEYMTNQDHNGTFSTMLAVEGVPFIGRGSGSNAQKSCREAAIDFCRRHYEKDKMEIVIPEFCDEEVKTSEVPDHAELISLPKSSRISIDALQAPEESNTITMENEIDSKVIVYTNHQTEIVSEPTKVSGNDVDKEDSEGQSKRPRIEVSQDPLLKDIPAPQLELPTCTSPWPNCTKPGSDELYLFAKSNGLSLPVVEYFSKSEKSMTTWRASSSWETPLGLIKATSIACRDKFSTLRHLGGMLKGNYHKLMKDNRAEPLISTELPKKVIPISSKQIYIEPPIDWNNPVLHLYPPESSMAAVSSWLNEDRNIGRLSQLVKVVQANAESASLCVDDKDFSVQDSVSAEVIEEHSVKLLQDAVYRKESAEGKASLMFRERMPAFQQRHIFLDAIAKNQVIIVSGPAGAGKSTQLPNLILEQMTFEGFGAQCNVIVTEPRRISAISLATRVAHERGEALGFRVGYQVRFENKPPEAYGGITYCTTGILLNKLKFNSRLFGYSHIVIDEAHERDLFSDVSLILIRDLLLARPELRLIIMSASLEVKQYANYFSQFATAVLDVPGPSIAVRKFWIDDLLPLLDERLANAQDSVAYLDSLKPQSISSTPLLNVSYSLLEAMIGNICQQTSPEESILVFLPGWEEITALNRCLLQEDVLGIGYQDPMKYRIQIIHSQMRSLDQRSIFEIPPRGVRKIVLSTNIAESSITIEDIVHVVDSAKMKVSFYEGQVKARDLSCYWISQSNCIQRSGRAGRVKGNGFYYCMMTKSMHDKLPKAPIPEILRADLQDVCLMIRALLPFGSIEDVLHKAIDAPEVYKIKMAILCLQELNAMTENEQLTSLGQLLAKLPLPSAIGKMVLYGIILRCLDPILIVAASMVVGSPFSKILEPPSSPISDYRKIFGSHAAESDHVAIVDAYLRWREERIKMTRQDEENQFCLHNGLSLSALSRMQQLKQQLEDILEDAGILTGYHGAISAVTDVGGFTKEAILKTLNEKSLSTSILKSVVMVGLHPQLALSQRKRWRNLSSSTKETMLLHPTSVVYLKANLSSNDGSLMVLGVQEKMQSRNKKTFAVNVTVAQHISMFFYNTLPCIGKMGHLQSKSSIIEASTKHLRPSILGWIGFNIHSSEATGLNMLKIALDYSIANMFTRILSSCSSRNRRNSEVMSRSNSVNKLEKLEFSDDEILSYIDKIIRTVTTLIVKDSA